MHGALANGEAATAPAAEDARLNALFHDYLKELFQREPLTATRLGEHGHDDQLDDLSPQARQATLDFKRRTLASLPRSIDVAGLSRDGKIDYEIFRGHLEREVWLAENFRPFEDDPRIYGDYISESVYLLLTQSSLPRAVNLKNALARMEKIPGVVEIARRTIKKPPRVKVETAIRQTEGAISFYKTDLFTLAGQPPGQGELAARAHAIVAVLEDYLVFLRTQVLPRADADWRIGRDLFRKKLDLELDAGLSAEEVLDDAEREAARVETEMGVVARQLWGSLFPGVALPPDDADGRRAMIQRVLDAPGGRSRTGRLACRRCSGRRDPDQGFHQSSRHPAAARARPVPDHRDAGIHARQLGGLPESGAAARRPGLERVLDQPASSRLEQGAGREPAS